MTTLLTDAYNGVPLYRQLATTQIKMAIVTALVVWELECTEASKQNIVHELRRLGEDPCPFSH